MERLAERSLKLSFSSLTLSVFSLGEDLAVLISGGEREHIGTAVLSVPRPSLKNDGSVSSTSSVLNLPGHKDEVICRMVSEKLSSSLGRTVLATGGFHIDGLSKAGIKEVVEGLEVLSEELASDLRFIFEQSR